MAWAARLAALTLLVGIGRAPASAGAFRGNSEAKSCGVREAADEVAEALTRRAAVKAAMGHAWAGYARYAWGADELLPHARAARNWTSSQSLGLTIVDSLDTLWLMGMSDEFAAGLSWVQHSLRFDTDVFVNLFEISIRCLGGLLSAYHLSRDPMLLAKAEDLGQRLLPAMQSASGVPFSDVNLHTGAAESAAKDSSLSEATSIQLEFKYLSNATGDARYGVLAEEAMDAVFRGARNYRSQGARHLLPLFLSPHTGDFRHGVVSLGARGDSYYEYLLKQFLLGGKRQRRYHDAYLAAVDEIKEHLIRPTRRGGRLFVGELQSSSGGFVAKMDHLVCFLPGTLALGHMHGVGRDAQDLAETLRLAEALMETCYALYSSTATGLAPEIVQFEIEAAGRPRLGKATKDPDIFIKAADSHYILRPEAVESLFLLYRATGEKRYRDYGWRIFNALEEHCRVPTGGYAGVDDVLSARRPGRRDTMETFFTGETLKYLYLLFSEDDILDLHTNVLNTEAHVLPVIGSA